MARAAATSVRLPRTKAKVADVCSMCPSRIKPGQWIGLHFDTKSWVHIGCLIRKMHEVPV